MSQTDVLILENDSLALRLNAQTGVVESLRNKQANLELITLTPEPVAWRLETESGWTSAFEQFSSEALPEGLRLRWQTADGLTVEARIELPQGSPQVSFRVRVENGTNAAIDKIEYPIFGGIGALSDSATNRLLHSQGTGFLFENPHTLFQDADENPRGARGLRYSPYPEGFSGSPMQLMAYYADGLGGFDFTAQDASGAMKWLNFYKTSDGALECSLMHQNPAITAGGSFDVPYPVLVGALVEGNWYEAAERYKAWALQQRWVTQGTLRERAQVRPTFLDEVGISTFAVNAAHDRSAWLDYFHQIAGTPVFHIIGVNWAKGGGDYHNGLPGGRGDWFPTRFNQTNIDTIRRNGDSWAPFEFNLLLATDKAESEQVTAALQVIPEEKYSFDKYAFPFVCPATEYQQEFHRWRDETLIREHQPDSVYYDISVNNVLMACRNPNHGHPVGGGGWMVDACREMFTSTKQAMESAQGRYVPIGTEMINEVFLQEVDYYQARAEASPLSSFEGDFFRSWLVAGTAEKVPLFTYVYHEYAPVRMDGWSKLSVEVGDLYYWVASRVTLWGGLFEINCEFSALEALGDQIDLSEEHYYRFDQRNYPVDPAKAAFVGGVAAARTTFARDYLVYGTMLRPLPLEVAPATLDYFLYNAPHQLPHYGEHNTKTVPSVIHSAWRSPEGKIGFLFVNLLAEPQRVRLPVDRARYGLPAGAALNAEVVTSSGRTPLALDETTEIELSARRVVLVELAESVL